MIEKKVSTYSIKENHPEKEGITFSVELTINHEKKSFDIKPEINNQSVSTWGSGFIFTNSAKRDTKMWKAVIKAIDKAIDFAEEVLKMEDNINKDMDNFKKSIPDEKPLFISLESQFSEDELNELKSGVDVETVILNRVESKINSQR